MVGDAEGEEVGGPHTGDAFRKREDRDHRDGIGLFCLPSQFLYLPPLPLTFLSPSLFEEGRDFFHLSSYLLPRLASCQPVTFFTASSTAR